MLRPLAASTFLISVLVILATPSGARAQAAGDADVQAGGRLYNASCRICHGEGGVGHRAPTLRGSRLTLDYTMRIIAAGKNGTMMPSFQNAFKPEQIRQLAVYVMSLQRPDSPWAALRGSAAAGERVFYDASVSHSCHGCHTFKGEGARVGPDLTARLKGKTPFEIFQKIVIVPHRSADPAYVNVGLVLRNGDKLTGIKAEETETEMRFYDTSVLPPKVLTLAKADIVTTTRLNGSAMPSDYASRLPLQQLLDLVSFLKSGADGTQVTVTFADVISERPSTGRR